MDARVKPAHDEVLRRFRARLLGRRDGARRLDVGDLAVGIAEHLLEDLLGMLAEQRRALHVGDRVRHLYGIADGEVPAAHRMVDLDHGAGRAQRRLFGEFLHRQDRSHRNVERVADLHDLKLGLGLGPLLDGVEDVLEARQPRRRRGVVGIGLPFGLADEVADLLPHRRLGDEVDVGVGIVLPAFAFENPARLAAARIVAGARHGGAERNALAVLAVFLERPVLEALLVAQLDAGEIEHAVLHGGEHALAAAGAVALIERCDDAEREVQPGAGIADLRPRHQRRALAEAGGGGGAAGALGDVLVDLAVLVGSGSEALDRGDDHARVELMNALEREAHAVEGAGREILHQHVAALDQARDDLRAPRVLGADRDRALVAIEHGEGQAVDIRDVAQLAAGDVADPRTLDLDHVGAHVAEQLGAGGPRLHVGEIEHAYAVERLAGLPPRQGAGLRQPIGAGLARPVAGSLLRRLSRRGPGARPQRHDLLGGGAAAGLARRGSPGSGGPGRSLSFLSLPGRCHGSFLYRFARARLASIAFTACSAISCGPRFAD